jgi:hypothetical protein
MHWLTYLGELTEPNSPHAGCLSSEKVKRPVYSFSLKAFQEKTLK